VGGGGGGGGVVWPTNEHSLTHVRAHIHTRNENTNLYRKTLQRCNRLVVVVVVVSLDAVWCVWVCGYVWQVFLLSKINNNHISTISFVSLSST
jgi:hypothetical protein